MGQICPPKPLAKEEALPNEEPVPPKIGDPGRLTMGGTASRAVPSFLLQLS